MGAEPGKAAGADPRALPSAPIDLVLAPFRAFTGSSAASGVLLLAATAVAMVAANSPWSAEWADIWETDLGFTLGDLDFSQSLLHWINDGLMAIFFLVVGLEIKREILVGELASARRAILPIVAAVGGASLPAIIFLLIVGGAPESRGWGVPMATDIAFAIGAMAILGSRVPAGLRVFLVALAIVDDLLAVLVIAIFYTSNLSLPALAVAAAIFGGLVLMNALGVRHPLAYGVVGIGLWLAMFQSGVHASIAGVLLALTIPARVRINPQLFRERARAAIDDYEGAPGDTPATTEEQQSALWELEDATSQAQAPMNRLEHDLQPWAMFVIMPLFALANAGVAIRGEVADMVVQPVFLGVVLGLVIGKQVGITLATFAVVRLGLGRLPAGVGWRHVYGAAWLGGIGFTMSLFIATLAYEQGPTLDVAKLGILAASVVAGIGGVSILWRSGRVGGDPAGSG